MIAVNLTSVFLCMKHELIQMERQGSGAIVNTSSGAGSRRRAVPARTTRRPSTACSA